ncbi:MAG: diversity-generating retroelement protein Avd [Candidatus Brocadiae bacterium]|nr:diversity-generating retroelement protein Avd [Candidatus Brocadiia bacterium]
MDETKLYIFWCNFMDWLWQRTESFPKTCRYTLSNRIDNLSLDILEGIVEATYSSKERKVVILREMNLKLEKMRVILRIAFQRKHLHSQSFSYASAQLQEAGRMVGGWLKNREES